jgi:hypothetical protein
MTDPTVDDLDDILTEAEATPAHTASLEIALGDNIVAIEFRTMSAMDWSALVAAHPRRDGSTIDARLGFNTAELAVAGAPLCAKRIVGDERRTITKSQWARIFASIVGGDLDNIAIVMWGLNVLESRNKVLALKKAQARSSRASRASRASSASPSAASKAGSPATRSPRSTTRKGASSTT